MNIAGLLFLLIAHYLCGRGILKFTKVALSPAANTCLSFIVGVPVLSFVPCFIQLLHIPITGLSVALGIVLVTIILCFPFLRHFKRPKIKATLPSVYELPFIFIILLLLSVSAWRCFYYPPYSRDMLTGPELLAEFAVREKTMASSVFTIDLHTTNNYFKSPYITGLQIIYKLFVCPFGQVWLSILSFSFIAWLYTLLRSRLHPLIAGMLLLSFTAVHELYAYSYLMLYDYSNMVLFFSGFYFLIRNLTGNSINDFIFSTLLFGFATYIRTETIVLIAMLLPLPAFYFYKQHLPMSKVLIRLGLFMLVPVAFYGVCIHIFIHKFIPIPFSVSSQVNTNLGDVSVFFYRLRNIATDLIFSKTGIAVYGYFIFFFVGLSFLDCIWPRRFNREALFSLYGIAVVYIGLAFIGYILPLADLFNTTKRGLFKILPIMLLYMSNSGILIWLSAKIRQWSNGA